LPGGHFPAFCRYYEAAKTSRAVSRRTFSCVRRCLSKDYSFRSPWRAVAATAPGRWYAGIVPAPARFSERRRGISPVSWQSSCAFALFFDPGRLDAPRSFSRHADTVPLQMNQRTPTTCHFSRLIRTASALAVYASCPPLDGLRNTRFRLADLPLPGGYRTRWTAIERFSFQMSYVISLPPRSQVLSGRDNFRDGYGERGEWPRLKLRMAGPGVDRHGHRKFEARTEGKTGVGFSPSKGRVAFCGAVRITHNARSRREQRQGNRTLSVPARRVAGRPKSVATAGAGLFGLEATRGCA
jgi:hypothetical protein